MWWWWFILVVGLLLIITFVSFVKPFQKRVSFNNKNVIITGGSAGIGEELSKLIAKEKINSITILARTASKLDKIAREISSYCDKVLTISCDVTNKESVKNAIDESVAKFGEPDILITCAGMATPGYFLEQDVSITEHTMQVDFFGTLYAAHRAAHHMAKKGQGHIIMISSTLANLGIVGYSSYCPAKYAVKGLAEVLRSELSPFNIKLSLVYPPDTRTPGYEVENRSKPADTMEISNMSTIFDADVVGAAIMAGIKKGDYHIAMDFFTKVFVSLSNSIAPRQYGILEVILFPLFILLGVITRVINDSIVKKHHKLNNTNINNINNNNKNKGKAKSTM